MTTFSNRLRPGVTALILAVLVAACESSDRIPPKGATVTVAANPATIALASSQDCVNLLNISTGCGTAEIVATVASELGTPLPNQDVRFSSSAGFLFTGTSSNPVDAGNIPISTDDFGNAHVNLITSTTATVTAKSGPASGTLTINTVSGNLSQIVLNLDTTSTGCSTSSSTVTSCSQIICLQAVAQNSTGTGIQGVVLLFSLQNNVSGSNTFNGVFTPSQVTTDSTGKALAKFSPDSTCAAQCTGGKSCQAEIIAQTQGGSFQSSPLQLQINIP